MLVALQHNNFSLWQTDQRQIATHHTHGPWSDNPTPLHKPATPPDLFRMYPNCRNSISALIKEVSNFQHLEIHFFFFFMFFRPFGFY